MDTFDFTYTLRITDEKIDTKSGYRCDWIPKDAIKRKLWSFFLPIEMASEKM